MSNIFQVGDKFAAIINGKTVKRANRRALERMLKADQVAAPVVMRPKCQFSPTQRFVFINKFIKLLGRGAINSFIVTGSGGIGKTTAVTNALTELELNEDTPNNPGGDYMVIRGFSTPRALYETLYNFRDKILVLDDADQAWKDPLASNLLKACLDDKKVRIVNWNSSREDTEIPTRFVYTGKIVFVSNLPIDSFPQAIVSRSQKVDLTLDIDEKIEVISHVFDKLDKPVQYKNDVLAFVREFATEAKDLNIRSAVSLFTLRENFGADWRDIAQYSFCN
jgi:Cdc6-like AAA superfamily ATPase